MSKITAYSPIFIATALTVWINCVRAQEPNKPAAPAVVTPSVNQVPIAYTTDVKVNYVRTWEPMGPIQTSNGVLSADYLNAKQSTQYIDGIGRPLQTVVRQITPQAKDMVSPVLYDGMGREVFKYLPYVSTEINGLFKMDPFADQAAFYQNTALNPGLQGEQVYYSKTEYDNSPLNRITKTLAPGNSWAGSNMGVSMEYQVNTPNDVRIWTIDNDPLTYSNNDITTNIPVSGSFYNAGQLYKNVVKDEVGNAIVEYKDKEGKVLLKKVQVGDIAADFSGHNGFLCTYYIYDDLDRLRFVISPKAVEAIKNVNWQFTDNAIINELCFRYEYDARKRMIAKNVPGSGWTYMIYDSKDRVVFTQDANLHEKNQWMATLYDGLNRTVMTGIMSWVGAPAALQTIVTSQTATVIPPAGLQNEIILPVPGEPVPASIGGPHQAYFSITLIDEFVSDNDFTAEVFGGSSSVPQESVIDGIAVNANPIPSGAGFVALTKAYYDKYDWTNVTYSPAYNSYLELLNLNAHEVTMPAQAHMQATGLLTGSQVRVITDPNNLASGQWLTTVSFYDDRDRLLQSNSDNQENGKDIVTHRYDFTGKVISTYQDHTSPGGTPASLHIKTDWKFDHAGRLQEIWKTINDDDTKKALITKSEYDELGQLKNKKLGGKKDANGSYTGQELESLDYSYNIRGWTTGINKDYLDPSVNVNDKWFGMELSYDRGFDKNQYNGNVAGAKWRSRGNGERRAYGFTYDKANRLLGADYSQYDGSNYTDNSIVKFDVELGDGSWQNHHLAYDANGNIQSMKQWGLKLNSSTIIDKLTYTYDANSNKLNSVSESDEGAAEHKLGDFTDNNTSGNDYSYDANGNIVSDKNKRLNGIIYNHLNLPWQLQVNDNNGNDKGKITYLYDAAGNKLKKIVEDKSIAGKTVITTTSYVDGLIYESKTSIPAEAGDYTNKLQLVNHEEGRMRYIAAEGGGTAKFEYDYFVKDNLGHVRMVLTEEQLQQIYPAATLEGSLANANDAAFTENQYYNIDPANVVDRSVATGITDYPNKNGGPNATDPPVNNNPYSNVTANSQKLYKLKATAVANGGVNGLGIALKVMSGDRIDIYGKTYYFENNTTQDNYNIPVLDILTGFISAPSGAAAGKGVTASGLNSVTEIYNGVNGFLSNPDRGAGTKPKAYINWILFDENFKYVKGSFERVDQPGQVEPHTLSDISVTKNGYLYVYVSNESPVNVFFDNLQVIHTHGALLEETHYYPYGLTMAGISSRAVTTLKNRFQFLNSEKQSEEFSDGNGLDMYDLSARFYDPQLGRFWQIDPMAEYMRRWSPYAYGFDNPVRFTDANGMTPTDTTETFVNKDGTVKVTELEEVTVTGVKKKSSVSSWLHGALDVVGIFDPFGIADGLNAVIYLAEGNYKDAALSAIGMLPLGDIAKGLKWADEAEEVVEGVVKYEDEVAEVAEKNLVEHSKLPCGCFIAGTLILTDSSYKRIEQIKEGDKVWAYNDTTHLFALKNVVRVFKHVRDTVYRVHIGTEIINTTSDHPFFIGGRWLQVKDLRSGDSVTTYHGRLAISRIDILIQPTTVYNFEVADYHTYYVSARQVLVHNNGPCDFTPGKTNRTGDQTKLKSILNDPKASAADKGWVKQEMNRIKRGQTKDVRTPPGKVLAHKRGKEAAKGFSYKHSNLQIKELHKMQHKYDNFGRANKINLK